MNLKITGTIREVLPEDGGEGKNGPWRKQDYIIETGGQYPKQICITAWGDNIETFALTEGETVEVSIDIQSREYNGRWYTDVKAWKCERPEGVASAPRPDDAVGDPLPTETRESDIPF